MTLSYPARCGPNLLSIIVPCLDEEEVIRETHQRLDTVLGEGSELDLELIYVDDGSRDSTLEILRDLQRDDSRVRVIALSRNFGQQVAITAGLQSAAGDVVAVMDADLQDPPEVILEMLECWRQGTDVAYGLRVTRDGETKFKRWTAHGFYRFLNSFTNSSIPPDAGEFRVMDRVVVDTIVAMPERDRFVRGMVAWAGFRQEAVAYQRPVRSAGETKYRLGKMLDLAISGILSFSLAPLRLATFMGFLTSGLAMSGIFYVLVVRFLTDAWVPGWAMLLITILFLGGLQMVIIGVIGEYVGRIYMEVKRRPLYLVKERLGFTSGRSMEGPKN